MVVRIVESLDRPRSVDFLTTTLVSLLFLSLTLERVNCVSSPFFQSFVPLSSFPPREFIRINRFTFTFLIGLCFSVPPFFSFFFRNGTKRNEIHFAFLFAYRDFSLFFFFISFFFININSIALKERDIVNTITQCKDSSTK